MRKMLSVLVKAGMSGLLLYFALRGVDIHTVVTRLTQINFSWLALALATMLIQQAFLTVRWQQLLRLCGGDFLFRQLFRLCMIGIFFSQTLPSSVGGDAMRIWLLGKLANWRLASYSVLLDRVVGVLVLAIVVVVCFPWTLILVRDPIGRSALLTIGLGSIGGGFVFVMLGSRRLHFMQQWSPTRHLASISALARQLLRSPRFLAPIFGVSVFIHLLTVLAAWFIARAIGADLSLQYALFLVLPVILIAAVPISIAGWGVREGAMVAAFGFAGLAQSDGLVVSILLGGIMLAVGALGGLMWVFYNGKTPPEAASASSAEIEA